MQLMKVNGFEMNHQFIIGGRQKVLSHYQHIKVCMNAFLFHLQF